ncbi:PilZ domain-containing protein [Alkalilimnicola ehrlichii]|uniref:PilZ domain-containing protein n=1 Tax=Alkalilimnicola ehrlichii TaxID=351052 RepID=UPI003BA1DEA9
MPDSSRDSPVAEPGVGARLAIELNNTLHLSTPSGSMRMKARLVGMISQRCLIIQAPAAERSGQFRKLFPFGDTLLVRYLHDGVVFGFRALVSGVVLEPEPLVFLGWPKSVQEHSIRDSQRLETFMPCLLSLEGREYESTIVDISQSGCQCVLLRREGVDAPDPEQSPAVSIRVATPGHEATQRIEGVVKRCHADQVRMELGVAFNEPQEALYRQLMAYRG